MKTPTKTVFDFPVSEHERVEVLSEGFGAHWWYKRAEWELFSGKVLSELEARLVKREPRTVSGERSLNELRWLVVLCPNLDPGCHVRYTLTEVIPGADPEPDWKAECATWKRTCDTLKQAQHRMWKERDADRNRIRELEGELSAASAAVQKLEERNTTLQERSEYLEEVLKSCARAAEVTF